MADGSLTLPAGRLSLEKDSTIFERFGKREGSLKGYNPRRRRRPRRRPLIAVLAGTHFVLRGWLRGGNRGSNLGAVEYLNEALA